VLLLAVNAIALILPADFREVNSILTSGGTAKSDLGIVRNRTQFLDTEQPVSTALARSGTKIELPSSSSCRFGREIALI
jgi:hypothetical protein